MKKWLAVALAAGLTCAGATNSASAVEVKASGMMNFVFEGTQNVHTGNQFRDWSDFRSDTASHQKHFAAVQRLRINLDFIASENLAAHYQAQVGTFTWGGPAAGNVYTVGGGNGSETLGGALGTRAANIVTREAYLDWTVPSTDIKIRMGLQPLLMPGFSFFSPVLDNEGTAISVTAPVNENFTVSGFWLRAYSDARRGSTIVPSSTHTNDTMDVFNLNLQAQGQGFKVTPWVAGGVMGGQAQDVNGIYNRIWLTNNMLPVIGYNTVNPDGTVGRTARPSNSHFWFAGVASELTMFEPFRFALDFYYSASNTRHASSDRAGWFVGGSAEYKTACGTPTLKAWYASGDDGDLKNGSERPLSLMGGFTPGASIYFNTFRTSTADNFNRDNAGGMWGVSAQWNDIRFIRPMAHSLRVTYFAGTNNTKMAPVVVAVQKMSRSLSGPASYMTTKDSIVEVDLDTDYMIYQNLFAKLELAYAFQNFNGKVWKTMIDSGENARFSNAWRAALGMTYRF